MHNLSAKLIWMILQFLWGLGLPQDEAECCDVYGLDDQLLEMVPKPVLAVLFLYPITTQVCFCFSLTIIHNFPCMNVSVLFFFFFFFLLIL